jgi:hypothetical protein
MDIKTVVVKEWKKRGNLGFSILGIFEKLRKATISFIVSVCPSVCMELGSHSTDFHEIWYLIIFLKSVEKPQVSSESDKNDLYFA